MLDPAQATLIAGVLNKDSIGAVFVKQTWQLIRAFGTMGFSVQSRWIAERSIAVAVESVYRACNRETQGRTYYYLNNGMSLCELELIKNNTAMALLDNNANIYGFNSSSYEVESLVRKAFVAGTYSMMLDTLWHYEFCDGRGQDARNTSVSPLHDLHIFRLQWETASRHTPLFVFKTEAKENIHTILVHIRKVLTREQLMVKIQSEHIILARTSKYNKMLDIAPWEPHIDSTSSMSEIFNEIIGKTLDEVIDIGFNDKTKVAHEVMVTNEDLCVIIGIILLLKNTVRLINKLLTIHQNRKFSVHRIPKVDVFKCGMTVGNEYSESHALHDIHYFILRFAVEYKLTAEYLVYIQQVKSNAISITMEMCEQISSSSTLAKSITTFDAIVGRGKCYFPADLDDRSIETPLDTLQITKLMSTIITHLWKADPLPQEDLSMVEIRQVVSNNKRNVETFSEMLTQQKSKAYNANEDLVVHMAAEKLVLLYFNIVKWTQRQQERAMATHRYVGMSDRDTARKLATVLLLVKGKQETEDTIFDTYFIKETLDVVKKHGAYSKQFLSKIRNRLHGRTSKPVKLSTLKETAHKFFKRPQLGIQSDWDIAAAIREVIHDHVITVGRDASRRTCYIDSEYTNINMTTEPTLICDTAVPLDGVQLFSGNDYGKFSLKIVSNRADGEFTPHVEGELIIDSINGEALKEMPTDAYLDRMPIGTYCHITKGTKEKCVGNFRHFLGHLAALGT